MKHLLLGLFLSMALIGQGQISSLIKLGDSGISYFTWIVTDSLGNKAYQKKDSSIVIVGDTMAVIKTLVKSLIKQDGWTMTDEPPLKGIGEDGGIYTFTDSLKTSDFTGIAIDTSGIIHLNKEDRWDTSSCWILILNPKTHGVTVEEGYQVDKYPWYSPNESFYLNSKRQKYPKSTKIITAYPNYPK